MNVSADLLQCWAAEVFRRRGIPADDAQLTALLLVRTSLRGIDTHGIARVQSQAQCRRGGIPINVARLQDLRAIGARLGVEDV